MKKASILTIGSELIGGYTLDTHSQYLSRQLMAQGYHVSYHLSCDDTLPMIADALFFLRQQSDLIVTTGGLGPTVDDITRQAVAECMKLSLVVNESAKRKLETRFATYGIAMTDNNYQQAYFPEGAEILVNDQGTADGFLTADSTLTIMALPGPPREMRHVLAAALPRITAGDGQLFGKTLKLYGIGESTVDDMIADIDRDDDVELGIYAERGTIAIRLSTWQSSQELANRLLDNPYQAMRQRLSAHLFSCDERSLNQVVVELLAENSLTLSVAESCTGGQLASAITNISGASAVFNEGLVTYSNRAKIEHLGVPVATIERCGAVSAETAEAMVRGLAERSNSDIALAITGIAGPSGGSADKPVGTVYVALYYRDRLTVERWQVRGDRRGVQARTTLRALKMIYDIAVSST